MKFKLLINMSFYINQRIIKNSCKHNNKISYEIENTKLNPRHNHSWRKISFIVKRASNSNPTVEANEKPVEHLEEKKTSPQKRGGKIFTVDYMTMKHIIEHPFIDVQLTLNIIVTYLKIIFLPMEYLTNTGKIQILV